MTINYTWTFSSVDAYPDVDGLTNVISTVHWRLLGEDSGYTAEVYGAISLDPVEDSESFIPFESLTPELLQEWVEQKMGDDLDNYKTSISGQIDARKNPPVVSPPLPWAAAIPTP